MKKKVIPIPIYGGQLIIKQVENWEKVNRNFGFDCNEFTEALTFSCTKENQGFECHVWFHGKPSNSTIVHECVHIVNRVFTYRGVKLNNKNDETQAYFTDWVFQQIENYYAQN